MKPIRLFHRQEIGRVRQRGAVFSSAEAPGELIRLRRNVYAIADEWRMATSETRVVTRAHALQMVSKVRPVFANETAAGAHGAPLYRADNRRVHVIAPDNRPGAADGVIRHRGPLGDDEIVERNGLLCTSLPRTVADVSRTRTFEQATVVADAALRRVSVPRNGVLLRDAAEEFRENARRIAHSFTHGVTRADRVLDFADGRAQLTGESLSRIRLVELGFRRIRLQVGVPAPNGTSMYWVDFGLDDDGVDALGEYDGHMKYVDGRMLRGRSSADALDDEKQREDWIRGVTQRRLARWGSPHIRSAEALGLRLAAFGIEPPT